MGRDAGYYLRMAVRLRGLAGRMRFAENKAQLFQLAEAFRVLALHREHSGSLGNLERSAARLDERPAGEARKAG